MSHDTLENYPEDKPDYEPSAYWQAAYLDYFEGFAFRDVEQVRFASNIFEKSTEMPFSNKLHKNARRWESAYLDCEDRNDHKLALAAITLAAKSYVYSELTVKPNTLIIPFILLDQDTSGLVEAIYPDKTVLAEITKELPHYDKKEIKFIGKRVIYELGLASRGLRLAMRLRHGTDKFYTEEFDD